MIRCVDLFSGAGGFSLGFRQRGFDIIGAVDRSEAAMETYRHNFQDTPTFEQDVREFNAEVFESETDYSRSDVHVIIGGPPCKGFSTAGQMDSEDPRNELVVSYAETVGEFDPEVVVMENVAGLLSMKDGEYVSELRSSLSEQGYTLQQPQILLAADYGVPQLRKRVIIVATRSGEFKLPTPTHYPDQNQAALDSSQGNQEYVTVEQAIDDLSFLRYGQESQEYKLRPRTDYQREMRRGAERIHNHVAPNHGETVRERFNAFDPGQTIDELDEQYQTSKHSMYCWDPEQPSPTITTLPEDFVHYERLRIPTVREMARIQSFPDWFEFRGPRTTGGTRRRNSVPQYTQVGNAVPPRLASAIAGAVQQYFDSTRVTEDQVAEN